MPWGLRFVAWAGPAALGEVPKGAWLKRFDADARGGRGQVEWTMDIDDALAFVSFQAAMDCWRMQSTVVPFRDDGAPNRPLSSATVSVERWD